MSPVHFGPPTISGFTYIRPLGSGGFASVYLYEQNLPRRHVAVKVLDPKDDGLSDQQEVRRVFESEADTMALLSSHPSVVSIYSASISLEGAPYFTMEYCPDSMGAQTRGQPAALKHVLDTGVRLAGALETAHRAGVLHRDIKPSNVLLDAIGRPVMSDFGISHLIGQEVVDIRQRAMSIPWSAPEVVSMESTGSIATEVWALGATLYTFAAGQSPFHRKDPKENTRTQLSGRIKRALYSAIPTGYGYEGLDRVLSQALRKSPSYRFTSMEEFGLALQSLQSEYGLDITPLEINSPQWVPQSGDSSFVRGPIVSRVGRVSRAEARAERMQQDEDSLTLVGGDKENGFGRGIALGIGLGAVAAALAGLGVWFAMGGAW